jgi:hypothetical protein
VLGPVVEIKAIDLVDKGLSGGVLREYQRIIFDLYVIVKVVGTFVSRTIDVLFTSRPPGSAPAPSTRMACSGDTRRLHDGTLSARALDLIRTAAQRL